MCNFHTIELVLLLLAKQKNNKINHPAIKHEDHMEYWQKFKM